MIRNIVTTTSPTHCATTSDSPPRTGDRAVSMRCARSWSTPKAGGVQKGCADQGRPQREFVSRRETEIDQTQFACR